MNNTFEYFQTVVVGKELDVEDIGNCVILGVSDTLLEYYLIVQTEYGFTTIIEYGPSMPDIRELPDKVSYLYQRFEYNEYKINKAIKTFLNNNKYMITDALIIDLAQAKTAIKSMVDYL